MSWWMSVIWYVSPGDVAYKYSNSKRFRKFFISVLIYRFYNFHIKHKVYQFITLASQNLTAKVVRWNRSHFTYKFYSRAHIIFFCFYSQWHPFWFIIHDSACTRLPGLLLLGGFIRPYFSPQRTWLFRNPTWRNLASHLTNRNNRRNFSLPQFLKNVDRNLHSLLFKNYSSWVNYEPKKILQ